MMKAHLQRINFKKSSQLSKLKKKKRLMLTQYKRKREKKKKQNLQNKKNKELSFLRLMMKSQHITVMILMNL